MKEFWVFKRKWRKYLFAAIGIGVLLSAVCVFSAEGEAEAEKRPDLGRWFYQEEFKQNNQEKQDREPLRIWRHYGPDGNPDTGWKRLNGFWYFLSTEENENKGRMMTGWQWIDGRCYYLSPESSAACPEGAMYVNRRTPDGYLTGSGGAWLMEDGTDWYVPGKGISGRLLETDNVNHGRSGRSHRGSGSSNRSRGRNSGSSGASHAGNREKRSNEEVNDSKIYDRNGSKVQSPMPSLKDTGTEEIVPHSSTGPVGDSSDKQATPSQVRRIRWELRFADEKDRNREILRRQSGVVEEGRELLVDYPDTVLFGTQRYTTIEKGPRLIRVAGAGIQKYEILYRLMVSPAEVKEEQEERKRQAERIRLSDWVLIASNADKPITGRLESGRPLITENQNESGERLKNLISMVHDGERHEIYLVAKNHIPTTVVIGQAFPEASGISERLMDEFSVSEDRYRIIRVGFYKTWKAENCNHVLECVNHVAAGCLTGGHDTYRCFLCGFEETLFIPAAGHQDDDGDGLCDICKKQVSGECAPEEIHYQLADLQIRSIGGKPYRFRCIDEDYRNDNNLAEPMALFLCESVIRTDGGNGPETNDPMGFGPTNNYKTSNVRKWLQKNSAAASNGLKFVYTGVNTAYQGGTAAGEYEHFSHRELKAFEKPFQLMEDQMFLLSLEEAIQYRNILWKFNGSHEENPDSQYSPYSRGYYLRTPQYKGSNGFEYGDSIYTVDLADGSLHPADVSDPGMGIRPAFAVKQS